MFECALTACPYFKLCEAHNNAHTQLSYAHTPQCKVEQQCAALARALSRVEHGAHETLTAMTRAAATQAVDEANHEVCDFYKSLYVFHVAGYVLGHRSVRTEM